MSSSRERTSSMCPRVRDGEAGYPTRTQGIEAEWRDGQVWGEDKGKLIVLLVLFKMSCDSVITRLLGGYDGGYDTGYIGQWCICLV